MINAQQFKEYKKKQANGSLPEYDIGKQWALEYCHRICEAGLKSGEREISFFMDQAELPIDRYYFRHSFLPAVLSVIQELKELGYYVDILRLGGWLYQWAQIGVRLKPNLLERIDIWLKNHGFRNN